MRARLRYFNVSRDIKTLLVTSGAPGDGKTTVARNLADAAAISGSSVLLIEGDLRHPVLAAEFRDERAVGLSDVLTDQVPLDEAVSPYRSSSTSRSDLRLDVLFSGRQPPNPAELIDSDAMRHLLIEVRNRYDMIVIDSPPISQVSDAIPLVGLVDGVIVVVRLGRSTRDSVTNLKQQITQLDGRILGIAVNSTDIPAGAYGYPRPP